MSVTGSVLVAVSVVVVVVGSVREVVSPRGRGVGDGVYRDPPAPPYGWLGSDPARVPGGLPGAVARAGLIVNADVVSAFVPVIGGTVSPGP